MTTTKLREVQCFNQQASRNKLKTYRSFLFAVSADPCFQPFGYQLRRILSASRTLDTATVRQLLDYADSLSSQKYMTSDIHYRANQVALFIKKYPFPRSCNPYDPEKEAISKFLQAERSCARTNRLFALRRERRRTCKYDRELSSMRSFIAYVLGCNISVDDFLSHCNFGPGANIGTQGGFTSKGRKILNSEPTVSPGASIYALHAVLSHAQLREEFFPAYATAQPNVSYATEMWMRKVVHVGYNKIAFVPKTAKIHRSIAVEPLWNSYLQKGADEYMRKRLARVGIDLSKQEPNAVMACEGSYDGETSFVTIDLSSASDSVSTELVREVLPPEWFEVLNSIRSKSFLLGKEKFRYEKFCSMGNGFCFPLETLIFAAACHALGAGRPGIDYRVYGDDIVVRKPHAVALIRFLRYLGFRTNKDKTFLSGPFRESCGSDFFNGVDVRPFTLDFELDSLSALFKAANGLIQRPFSRDYCMDLRKFIISQIRQDLRYFRPYTGEDSDSCLNSLGDEHLLSSSCRYVNGTWRWLELKPEPVVDRKINYMTRSMHPGVHMFAALSGYNSRELFAVRRETRTKVRWISHSGATSQWFPPVSLMVLRPRN